MNKTEFIDKATRFYALAVITYLLEDPSATSTLGITKFFRYPNDGSRQSRTRVHEGALLNRSLVLLAEEGFVTLKYDDFAPTIIIPCDDFRIKFFEFTEHGPPQYINYRIMGDGREEWLNAALDEINAKATRLGIEDEDYDNPDSEWQPIPVDRGQPEARALIDAVDDAAEKIRGDNGYSASKPEERNYVLDALTMFASSLREKATTSLPYIRTYLIEPLGKAAKSLGQSATGVAIEVAKAKLKEFLMKQGVPWPFSWP